MDELDELLAKPLFQCTLGDFVRAMQMQKQEDVTRYDADEYAIGVKEICTLCGCGWKAARKRVSDMGLLIKSGKSVMVNKQKYFNKLNQ